MIAELHVKLYYRLLFGMKFFGCSLLATAFDFYVLSLSIFVVQLVQVRFIVVKLTSTLTKRTHVGIFSIETTTTRLFTIQYDSYFVLPTFMFSSVSLYISFEARFCIIIMIIFRFHCIFCRS